MLFNRYGGYKKERAYLDKQKELVELETEVLYAKNKI